MLVCLKGFVCLTLSFFLIQKHSSVKKVVMASSKPLKVIFIPEIAITQNSESVELKKNVTRIHLI